MRGENVKTLKLGNDTTILVNVIMRQLKYVLAVQVLTMSVLLSVHIYHDMKTHTTKEDMHTMRKREREGDRERHTYHKGKRERETGRHIHIPQKEDTHLPQKEERDRQAHTHITKGRHPLTTEGRERETDREKGWRLE